MPPPYEEIVISGYPVDAKFPITYGYLDYGEAGYTKDAPHLGEDFGCPEASSFWSNVKQPARVHAIHLVDANNVPLDGWGNGSFGNCLILDVLKTRWYIAFCHASRIDVQVGDLIEFGQHLGLTGATGRVTGAHLHVQRSDVDTFPKDVTHTEDPMKGMVAAGEPVVVANNGATIDDVVVSLARLGNVVIDVDGSLDNLNEVVIGQNKVIQQMQARQDASDQLWRDVASLIIARLV
jgi:hypothetical protein